MTATSPHETWFQEVLDWIEGKAKTVETEIETIEPKIAKFADSVVNTLKNNPTAILIENGLVTAAEAIDPALTPMISGLELELPKVLNFLSNGALEIGKPLAQQGEDLLAWLQNLANTSHSAYAGVLTAINAIIQFFITSNNGIVATPAQTLASAIAVHANPSA